MSLGQFSKVKYSPSLKLKAAAELELRRRASSEGGVVPRIDAATFINDYIVIDDAQGHGDGVGTMPFTLWPKQRELLASIDTDPLLLILKARQLGITWLVCAYELYESLYKAQQMTLNFSIGQEEANEMMRRISVMYWRLPESLRMTLPAVKKDNTEEMAWANGSVIHSLPSRKSAGSGYTASRVVLDEFAKNENAAKLYTAVKPTIDGGGKMVILSTANGAGNLFHDMVTKAQQGQSRFAFRFLPWHARPGRDAAWYAEVAADAVDSGMMKQEYPADPDEAFEASEVGAFIDIALWDACEQSLPPLDGHTPCVLALDGAESNDTFASVITSAWGEGVAVRYVRPYVPIAGSPLDFDAIESDIRRLCERYALQEIAYDPFLLGQLIRRLTSGPNAIPVPCVPFPQGAQRLESDKALYDLITSRRLAHDGSAELRAHIANANKKIGSEGRKLRIVKRTYALKIDLAVATAMGALRALATQPRTMTTGDNYLADWRG